ncbi:MAG: DUF6655 family protein [Gemmataceae bacterium]
MRLPTFFSNQSSLTLFRCLAALAWSWCLLASGCGTTRTTNTSRTGTEQLLVSNAVDEAISTMDFQVLSGKKVYFDPQYLSGAADKGYLVSTLRQHLAAHGALLMEDRKEADIIVEARCGGLGTDQHDLLFGVPQMQLPAIVPGMPSLLPEIPLAKKIEQRGVAKVAVFAFNRKNGSPVWQSGVVKKGSTANDLWVLGAGPFRRGTIRTLPSFAGDNIPIPFYNTESEEDLSVPQASTAVHVTEAAVWQDPHSSPYGIQLVNQPPNQPPVPPGPAQ